MINLPNFKSLYGRIFAIFWLTLLIVLVAVLLAQNSDPRHLRDVSRLQSIKFSSLAKKVQNTVDHAETLLQGLETAISEHDEGTKLKLYFTNLNGELLFNNAKIRRNIQNFVSLAIEPNQPKARSYGRWVFTGPFLVRKGNEQALMYTGVKTGNPPPILIQILDRPFYLLLITMLVSTPLLLWLAWMVTTPARSLQKAAERITTGHFEIDEALERGPSEFRKAGASFNQMVGFINQMINNQQRLLSDISHELRSPLTRLRLSNAIAIRKLGESDELNRINTEADRMELMISELLSASRVQLNNQSERDNYDLTTLWLPLLEDAEFEAKQHDKKVVYDELPDMEIQGNAGLLYSALENVVRNAIKYAASIVEVKMHLIENKLRIIVSDDGPGVPEETLNDIFRPFYRVSSARDRESGGTGLGLAITHNAMLQHNGTANAMLNDKGGLTIVLEFKLS